MRKCILIVSVVLLSLGVISELLAEDEIPTSGTCNDAGTCLWSLSSDGTMTISAKDGEKDVMMSNYYCSGKTCGGSRPWNNQIEQIKSVYIGDNIINIGVDAFQNAANLKSITGMKDLKTIADSGPFTYTSITTFTIPDTVTSIGSNAFSIGFYDFDEEKLNKIIIPDSWADDNIKLSNELFKNSCFNQTSASTSSSCTDAKIVCKGDVKKCKTALAKFGGNGKCTVSYCIDSNKIVAADEAQCVGANYYWSGTSCNNKQNGVICAENWKRNEDFCNRIQYTPAEAAKVLRDDNTNEVTITFRK